MNKVSKLIFGSRIKPPVRQGQVVPSHVRNFHVAFRNEEFYIFVEDAEALGVVLFRVLTHQLHTEADSEYRLLQFYNDLIELVIAQIFHCSTRFSNAREN